MVNEGVRENNRPRVRVGDGGDTTCSERGGALLFSHATSLLVVVVVVVAVQALNKLHVPHNALGALPAALPARLEVGG